MSVAQGIQGGGAPPPVQPIGWFCRMQNGISRGWTVVVLDRNSHISEVIALVFAAAMVILHSVPAGLITLGILAFIITHERWTGGSAKEMGRLRAEIADLTQAAENLFSQVIRHREDYKRVVAERDDAVEGLAAAREDKRVEILKIELRLICAEGKLEEVIAQLNRAQEKEKAALDAAERLKNERIAEIDGKAELREVVARLEEEKEQLKNENKELREVICLKDEKEKAAQFALAEAAELKEQMRIMESNREFDRQALAMIREACPGGHGDLSQPKILKELEERWARWDAHEAEHCGMLQESLEKFPPNDHCRIPVQGLIRIHMTRLNHHREIFERLVAQANLASSLQQTLQKIFESFSQPHGRCGFETWNC